MQRPWSYAKKHAPTAWLKELPRHYINKSQRALDQRFQTRQSPRSGTYHSKRQRINDRILTKTQNLLATRANLNRAIKSRWKLDLFNSWLLDQFTIQQIHIISPSGRPRGRSRISSNALLNTYGPLDSPQLVKSRPNSGRLTFRAQITMPPRSDGACKTWTNSFESFKHYNDPRLRVLQHNVTVGRAVRAMKP